MKQKKELLRIAGLMVLILGLIFTVGCGGSGTQEWDSESDEPGQEEPSAGLTSFSTRDIYEADWDQSMFQDYSLTMINVWGTFCGPCLKEMPDLGALQDEYEPKGVNIVGIVVDVQDGALQVIPEQIELAREIAESTGADYTHLTVTEEMIDSVLGQFDSIPVTFFVDGDGNIVSEYYVGAREKEKWIEIIEGNLENL